MLLQEVGGHGVDGATFVASLGHQLGYHFAYAPADRFGDEETQGLAIMSRGPIDDVRILPLDHHHLRFKSRCRIAQAATVQTEAGRVRVVNVHLDTRINSKDRVAQLAPVIDMLDAIDGPQILGGDFNTMDVGWVQTMWPFPYFQHQVAAVRTRLAAERVSHAVHGRPRDLQVFRLADPAGLALSETARGGGLERGRGAVLGPPRRVGAREVELPAPAFRLN